MKTLFRIWSMVLLLSIPCIGFGQTTMDIYATQGNLNDIIEADTLANGHQAHDVYRLVSLDTTYLFTGTINVKSDISVIGVVDPVDGRPPCIQPAVLPDNTIPPTPFTIGGKNINVVFRNLYFLAIATNNTADAGGTAILVTADSVRLTVENCVFDGWQSFAIGYNGNWDDFFIKNCNFRNMVHPNQWYIGEVIRNLWPNEAYTDTLVMQGNTMLCINGYAACPVTKFYCTYFEFVDNKVLYTFKNPLFIFNVTDAKLNNNVFYGTYSGGIDQTEHPWWDNLWYPDSSYGVIALQPLSPENKEHFYPADTSKAESMRKVEVKDNIYFWPQAIKDLWATWNASEANWVRTPQWMNDRTIAMFADDNNYPYLDESGNVEMDLDYMEAINQDVLNGTTGNDIGLIEYFKQIRSGTAATDVWGYKITQVSGAADWVPPWPLPEVSVITSVAEKTPETLPAKFALKGVYPNPFNPQTTIEFTLDKPGLTNLRIYNVLGQNVLTAIDNEHFEAGIYHITVDLSNQTSGVYFCELRQGNKKAVHKMMLLK